MNNISVSEWLKAEQEYKKFSTEPQPKGSVTVEQYAEATSRSVCRARAILSDLRRTGLATSQRWKDGEHGAKNVFFLKPKKK